jgi:hypothetical protein
MGDAPPEGDPVVAPILEPPPKIATVRHQLIAPFRTFIGGQEASSQKADKADTGSIVQARSPLFTEKVKCRGVSRWVSACAVRGSRREACSLQRTAHPGCREVRRKRLISRPPRHGAASEIRPEPGAFSARPGAPEIRQGMLCSISGRSATTLNAILTEQERCWRSSSRSGRSQSRGFRKQSGHSSVDQDKTSPPAAAPPSSSARARRQALMGGRMSGLAGLHASVPRQCSTLQIPHRHRYDDR